MNKADTKQAKAEIRALKSNLSKRQKEAAKEIANERRTIRAAEIRISVAEQNLTRFVKSTTDRLAILEGRLNS
jgi:multidrug efflux pump subunit AcrA (membrane-fusion protein)